MLDFIVPLFCVKVIPFLHVQEIRGTEALYIRELILKIGDNLLDDTNVPSILGAAQYKIASHLTIEQNQLRVGRYHTLDLRFAITFLDIMKLRNILRVLMNAIGIYRTRLFHHSTSVRTSIFWYSDWYGKIRQ